MNNMHHTAAQPEGPRTVGLISNPHSGRNRGQLDVIRGIVAEYPNIHHRVTRDADELQAVLEEFARVPVEVLAINGGDGTVARIMTGMLERQPFASPPQLVLLPGGTTNMNAGDVGLRGRLPGAVRRLCRWSAGERVQHEILQRPVLRITGGDGQAAVCGMFFGAGAIIQGIEYCRGSVHTRGVSDEIGPGLALLRTIWGIVRRDRRFLRPVAMSVQHDNAEAEPARDILIVLVSSLERLFLGLRPWWGAEHAPLHATLVEDDARGFLRKLPGLLRGRPGRSASAANGYHSHNVECIRLSMDGMWTLDGELYQARTENGPVTITSGGILGFLRL
jgi:hypothetical protein